jgi:hypothetical protein
LSFNKTSLKTLFFYKNLKQVHFTKSLLDSVKYLKTWYKSILLLKIKKNQTFLIKQLILQNWLKTFQNTFFFFHTPFIFFTKFLMVKDTYYSNYKLFFNFKKNRFFINLLNCLNKNYLSLSNGLFIKYFDFKKSLKKKKLLKLLLLKYLRKLFLILKINQFNLFIKSAGFFLNEFLTLLTQPSEKTFLNPLTKKTITDDRKLIKTFNFSYIFFLNTKNYSFLKLKKKVV